MSLRYKNNGSLHGFEDYRMFSLSSDFIDGHYHVYPGYSYNMSGTIFVPDRDLPIIGNKCTGTVMFKDSLCCDHKELVNTAKKVYVHPSCTISRTMVFDKYKKSLSPWLSDAVVIPTPRKDVLSYRTQVFFINEEVKAIIRIKVSDNPDAEYRAETLGDGCCLKDLLCMDISERVSHWSNITPYDVEYAEKLFYGGTVYVPNNMSYLVDLFTEVLPKEKIVYEETVQAALGTEDSRVDLTALLSIRDMLNSSDDEIKGAGLKALSTMDYMHCPNSIKQMLRETKISDWRHLSAANSTSVKFMLKQLYGPNLYRELRTGGSYDYRIQKEDYDLFIELRAKLKGITIEQAIDGIGGYNFMIVKDGVPAPSLIS